MGTNPSDARKLRRDAPRRCTPKLDAAERHSSRQRPIRVVVGIKSWTIQPMHLECHLRWGWVFLTRTRILSRVQFTTHFIDFFVVATKGFRGNAVNLILTRQTCGQRSSRAVESKRRALENYFPERICYMFQMSKCRGD